MSAYSIEAVASEFQRIGPETILAPIIILMNVLVSSYVLGSMSNTPLSAGSLQFLILILVAAVIIGPKASFCLEFFQLILTRLLPSNSTLNTKSGLEAVWSPNTE